MIVTTVVLTNAAQAKCFHSQCRSRMYAVTHQILNLNCALCLEPNGDQWNFGKQHQQGPQNSYPISARGLEGFNMKRHFKKTGENTTGHGGAKKQTDTEPQRTSKPRTESEFASTRVHVEINYGQKGRHQMHWQRREENHVAERGTDHMIHSRSAHSAGGTFAHR